MKHTKGKWEASISRGVWIVESVNNNNECSPICTMDDFDGEAVDKANANLMASAPEMLEELKMVAIGLKQIHTPWAEERIGYVEEIIAKAEGK